MANDLLLITGASSDIGGALIRRVLTGNPDSTVLAHSFRGGERIQTLQAEFGPERVIALTADLSDSQAVTALAARVLSHGVPRGFVHLPALRLHYDRFTKVKWDQFHDDLTIQVQSAGVLLQALLPKMSKVQGARVIFVLSSVTLGRPPKFMSSYTVIKYAQLGLMRALAAEYGSTNVRINAISPSMVETQFVSDIAEVAREISATANPLKRNAKVQDLIESLELLLGAGSEFINGVSLPITAGSE